jgi:hypothetical protein
MQIGGKCIQNLLVNMVLESKLSKDTNIKRHISMPLHLGMGLGFQFGIVQIFNV